MLGKLCVTLSFLFLGAQNSPQQAIPRDLPLVSENICEPNKAYILEAIALAQKERDDSNVIVIARLGSGEHSLEYSHYRLNKVKIALRYMGSLSEEKIITAMGDRTTSLPRIEIYVRGRLTVVINTKKHENIDLGGNGGCDGKRILRLKPGRNKG